MYLTAIQTNSFALAGLALAATAGDPPSGDGTLDAADAAARLSALTGPATGAQGVAARLFAPTPGFGAHEGLVDRFDGSRRDIPGHRTRARHRAARKGAAAEGAELKPMQNTSETELLRRLEEICPLYNARIYSKVRLADVLKIESGETPKPLFTFALMSHFDFVITDKKHRPLFAVEFDGPHHGGAKQQARDAKKNELCERFGFPLIRIDSQGLRKKYRGTHLITCLVEIGFLSESFRTRREEGEIPAEIPYDLLRLVDYTEPKQRLPVWLNFVHHVVIGRFYDAGAVSKPVPTCLVRTDEDDNHRMFAFLEVPDDKGVYVETMLNRQQVSFLPDGLIEEFAILELYVKLLEGLDDNRKLVAANTIERERTSFEERYPETPPPEPA